MTSAEWPQIMTFAPAYFERLWGGSRLRAWHGESVPADRIIGEAWLISDHVHHESVVDQGPLAGRSLRSLLEEDPERVLGSHARLTMHGRFPLLLKLLDTSKMLSVQVHPDDATAKRLGEPDTGKTEMWHILESLPGSELIGGLRPGTSPHVLRDASEGNAAALEESFMRIAARAGDSVFVPSGTVHAIGAGITLAEIQQNSDLTYRVYDFGRMDKRGQPRTLHIEKAMEAVRLDEAWATLRQPLCLSQQAEATRHLLSACPYFAAEKLVVERQYAHEANGASFHLVLCLSGNIWISAGGTTLPIAKGCAALVLGAADGFMIKGAGTCLNYYVPRHKEDVLAPLEAAGVSPREATESWIALSPASL